MPWYYRTQAGTLSICKTLHGDYRLAIGSARLGTFKTPEEAATYVVEHFSQRARSLFPGEIPPPDLSHWTEIVNDTSKTWAFRRA